MLLHIIRRYKFTIHLLHSIDTLLHGLSDSQITAGLALLITTSYHASCISAYHYNGVCYLMLMSLTTHVLAFVNIPEFGAKNHTHGAVRMLGIIATLFLTWELFFARGAKDDFPVGPVSLAVIPSACFVGNESSALSLQYYDTHNVSQLLEGPSGTGQDAVQYKRRFAPFAVFFFTGFIFLVVGWIHGFTGVKIGGDNRSVRPQNWVVWSCRVIITSAMLVIAVLVSVEYFKLRWKFEASQWYLADYKDRMSLGQLITILLAIPSFFAIVKVCEGKWITAVSLCLGTDGHFTDIPFFHRVAQSSCCWAKKCREQRRCYGTNPSHLLHIFIHLL